MTLLQHHVLALSLTAITTFGLGLLVFLSEPRRQLNRIFCLYSLMIFWWALTEAFLVCALDQPTANAWAYIQWIGVMFIAPTFVHTVSLLTEEKEKIAKLAQAAGYLVSGVCLLLHLVFPDSIAGLPRSTGYTNFSNRLGVLGTVIPIAFFILVNLGLYTLIRSYRKAIGQRRTQLKYLFWGSLIGYLGGSPDWFLVFGFYVPLLNPFGIYAVPLYSIAMTYAVLHHKLFDVNLVIRKSLVYSILVTILTVSYFGFVYMMERFFQLTFGYQSVQISLAAFALMALAFQPLKIGIQRLVDRLFFRAPHEELMKRLERLEQEALQGENRKAVATLAAGMAHEIKNPLSSIKTFAAYLPKKYDDPEFREKFSRIVGQEVNKITTMVQELLDFAKPKPPEPQPTQLSKLIDETIEFLHGSLVDKHITVMRAYSTQDSVWVDPSQMKQVFLNLLMNSIQAMHRAGCITISTVAEDGHLAVLVADTGPGIPRQDLSKVFDPFYTTKPDGTGLGLSVVHSIIREHRGKVTIDSDVGRGTTVRIQLPTQGGRG